MELRGLYTISDEAYYTSRPPPEMAHKRNWGVFLVSVAESYRCNTFFCGIRKKSNSNRLQNKLGSALDNGSYIWAHKISNQVKTEGCSLSKIIFHKIQFAK